ncbi:MAG: hypothetical protein HFJ17_04390, partial [Clostridia bacterium]|nr:hypothetical protein [Clostridia bacterium]
PSIKYDENSINDKYKATVVAASTEQDKVDKIKAETNLEYENILKIENVNNGGIYPTEHKNNNGSKKYSTDETQVTAEFTAARLLSAQDDDLGVSNIAEVTELHMTDKPKLIETIDSSQKYFNDPKFTNPTGEVYTTITPPTGSDMIAIIIYTVAGILSLAVISGGIVIIKKKVLHK